jgi:predicted MPP superfamily phosphohydrolase
MISEIAELLARAGLGFTPRELEDILWLASRLDAPQGRRAPEAPDPAAAREQELDDPVAGDVTTAGDDAPAPSDPLPARAPDEPAVPLHAKDTKGSIAGSILRVRGPSQGPAPEAFRRALHAFARRVPSRRQTRLDEEATVDRSADAGIPVPVFTPVRERRFDLTLVIEDCTSAELRETTLRVLATHFRRDGGLRAVRCYRLVGDAPPRLAALDGDAEFGIGRLKEHDSDDGRHLVLFATDGTSPRWRNGAAQAFLHGVGATTSVSLLHLLPRPAWRRTLIGEPDVALNCERPGERNARLHARLPWWMDADDAKGALPVPVLGLDAASLRTWARAIGAVGGASMPGVLVTHPAAPIESTVPPAAMAPDPLAIVARYRSMASEAAYRLAVYLSKTDPATIPIMRLVQRTMLPDAGEGELAEFLLGGLVTPAPRQDGQDERLYRFRDGVPDELIKALRYSEEDRIDRQLRLVGQALENRHDGPRNLEVGFPAPGGKASVGEWSLPFAQVSRQLLRGLVQPGQDLAAVAAGEAPSAGPVQARLRILHLSDLHFDDRPHPERHSPDVPFGPAWGAHLRGLAANARIDLVCVSGDLVWSAQPAAFARAGHLLDVTLEALGLPKSRLFVVPGNHDVQQEPVLSDSGRDDPARSGLTVPEEAAVMRAQSNYRDWLKRYLPHQFAATHDKYADFQVTLPGWVVPVHIVGIDSAWINAIMPNAALSEVQTAALERHPRDGLTVAMMHHRPEQLMRPRDLDQCLDRMGAQVFLHGSGPKGARSSVVWGKSGRVSSGVAMSTRSDEPMVFHVVDLVLDAAERSQCEEVLAYQWFKPSRSWIGVPAASRDAPALPPTAEKPSGVFVGRDAELAQLQDIFRPDKGRSRRAARCLLTGSAGVGKSAFAHHFADAVWSRSVGTQDPYVIVAAGESDELMQRLLGHFRLESMRGVAAHLRRNQTLLIIDGVDSPAQMDAAHRLALDLPACPILMVGRIPLGAAAQSLGWKVMSLAPLHSMQARALLDVLQRSAGAAITESEAQAIVDTLRGSPALIGAVAAQIGDTATAQRLLRWLGTHPAALPPSAQPQAAPDDFPDLLPMLAPVFEERWRAHFDEDQLDTLSMLAHGPLDGFSTSLGIALTGHTRRATDPAALRRFVRLSERAVGSGLLERDGPRWRFATPVAVAWLRARMPEQRASALSRWDKWVVVRLAAPKASRQRSWQELNELPAALIEWLHTCPLQSADAVRSFCVRYALAHGPLGAWSDFCVRILTAHPADSEASADWYLILAQLAHANGEHKVALEAVERYLERKQGVSAGAGADQVAIETALTLKARIEAQLGIVDTPPSAAGAFAILRTYQRALADAALRATLEADPRTRCIGMVVQALGTGLSATLTAYLDACRHSPRLEGCRLMVVVDRLDIAAQLVQVLHERAPDFELAQPASVGELLALLGNERPRLIVTTEQKMRQLERAFDGRYLVVGYALQSPATRAVEALPGASMIIFGDESMMFRPLAKEELGPVIAHYGRADAFRDGYLAPPTLRHVVVPVAESTVVLKREDYIPPRSHSEAEIRAVTLAILEHWHALEGGASNKGVLVVETVDDCVRFARSLSINIAMPAEILVLNASLPVADRDQVLSAFARSTHGALVVTTSGMASSVGLRDVCVCYVAARLAPAAQLRIESLVNRPGPDWASGEIVDFIHNDWQILSLAD